MKEFLLALQFLTVLPFKFSSITDKQVARSVIFFPLAGYLIGAMLVAAYSILTFVGIQSYLLCFLLMVLLIIITGGLHLDGLADTTDGFLSRKSPADMLTVMRDSRIGTMGVLSLICILLAKVFFMRTISVSFVTTALLLMCLISRWAMVLNMFLFPYARVDGKAWVYMAGRKRYMLYISTIIALFLSFITWGFWGIALMAVIAIMVVIFGSYCTKKIGGITGDTIGATSELTEVIILFSILIIGRFNPCLVQP